MCCFRGLRDWWQGECLDPMCLHGASAGQVSLSCYCPLEPGVLGREPSQCHTRGQAQRPNRRGL